MLRRRTGMTFMDVAVVLGILASLAAMVAPMVVSLRDSSIKARCLNNMRQLYVSYSTYAADNDDQVPLGYLGTSKRMNNHLFYSGEPCLGPMGLLYKANLLPNPEALMCPVDPKRVSLRNPWPPGADPKQDTISSYACRPVVSFGKGEHPAEPVKRRDRLPFPKLSDYQNKAILADNPNEVRWVERRHRTGVNVVYGDGSARWVDRESFNGNLSQIGEKTGAKQNDLVLNDKVTPPTGVWADLDTSY